jgi:hypothetical protein
MDSTPLCYQAHGQPLRVCLTRCVCACVYVCRYTHLISVEYMQDVLGALQVGVPWAPAPRA